MKISIVFRSFRKDLLDDLMMEIASICMDFDIGFSGPIYLPTKRKKFTVNRSPHIDKKSREQFEITTHSRQMVFFEVLRRQSQASDLYEVSRTNSKLSKKGSVRVGSSKDHSASSPRLLVQREVYRVVAVRRKKSSSLYNFMNLLEKIIPGGIEIRIKIAT